MSWILKVPDIILHFLKARRNEARVNGDIIYMSQWSSELLHNILKQLIRRCQPSWPGTFAKLWSLRGQHCVTGNFDTSQCRKYFTVGRSHHEPVPLSSAEMWKARPLDVSHVKLAKKDEWLRLRASWTITSNHPCGKAVAARIALGEPKCHRQSEAAQRPVKVTVYTFQCLALIFQDHHRS